jgi:TatD DNase family protein
MHLIDTHTHLYLEQFDSDRDDMLQRAFSAGIHQLFLPNIDKDSLQPMLELCRNYPSNCFPMIGLHPTSVGEDVNEQLKVLEKALTHTKFYAIGEIGIDLYWDKTFIDAQISAFRTQLDWAKNMNLPVVIHTREAFPLILDLVEEAQDGSLTGVFHCFTGSESDAERIMDMNFMMGIGGVVTYKKSHLPEVLQHVPLDFMVLETDSPYLPPVPYRGKRNESSYMTETALKLAEIKGVSMEEIAQVTTRNAQKLFKISSL